jgi:hypothetical protein
MLNSGQERNQANILPDRYDPKNQRDAHTVGLIRSDLGICKNWKGKKNGKKPRNIFIRERERPNSSHAKQMILTGANQLV